MVGVAIKLALGRTGPGVEMISRGAVGPFRLGPVHLGPLGTGSVALGFDRRRTIAGTMIPVVVSLRLCEGRGGAGDNRQGRRAGASSRRFMARSPKGDTQSMSRSV